MNIDAAEASTLMQVAALKEAKRTTAFTLVPIADLDSVHPAQPAFAWEDLVPLQAVTLFSAHGGAGKSFVMLQLAVAAARGQPLFKKAVRRCNVAFLSAEDGAATLRYRLHFILGAMNVSVEALAGRLFILDATVGDPVLFAEFALNGRREGIATSAFDALAEFVKEHEIGLLIIDNASDTFDANEIERAKVRGFMRSLANLAREGDLAVVLIAHVDKATSRANGAGTEAYSGSTAWHNSARSRLFMRREADGALTIEHHKNNFGPLQPPMRLLWPKGGIPYLDEPEMAFEDWQVADAQAQQKAVLKLVNEYTERGERVATAHNGRPNAAQLFSKEPTFPRGLRAAEVADLLRQAERAGMIERETYRGPDRKPREAWRLTPHGLEFIGAVSAACAVSPGPAADAAKGAR